MPKKKVKTKGASRKGSHYRTLAQEANIILAARGQSACPAAIKFVKKVDKKFKLKKG